MNALIIFVSNLLLLQLSESHPTGAPAQVCKDLTPQHGAQPQTIASPYRLVAHLDNKSIELTIESTQNIKFRGFAVQARRAHKTLLNDTDEPIGHFIIKDNMNVHTIDCAGHNQNTITHSNNEEKQLIEVIWSPPEGLDKDIDIKFVGTVLKDAKTFWINLSSEPISLGRHEVIKGNSIDEQHNQHKKDFHTDHIRNSSNKLSNCWPKSSLDYLLILSFLTLFCRN